MLAREEGATLMMTWFDGQAYIHFDKFFAATLLTAIVAYGVGKVVTEGKTIKLIRQLQEAEREVEDLREFIWLTSLSAPTAPADVKAQALPDPSQVERLRRLNSELGGTLA